MITSRAQNASSLTSSWPVGRVLVAISWNAATRVSCTDSARTSISPAGRVGAPAAVSASSDTSTDAGIANIAGLVATPIASETRWPSVPRTVIGAAVPPGIVVGDHAVGSSA